MSFAPVNKIGEKVDKNHCASSREMTRIIVYLRETKSQANISLLIHELGINSQKLRDAVNWLVSNKILLKNTLDYGRIKNSYYINPEWEKIKIRK